MALPGLSCYPPGSNTSLINVQFPRCLGMTTSGLVTCRGGSCFQEGGSRVFLSLALNFKLIQAP